MKISGIFAASVTPLNEDHLPVPEEIPRLLEFLDERGCDGALLLGTTGEGPSFSFSERKSIIRGATKFKDTNQNFKILAGTGEPSIDAAIQNTKTAFDLGVDGVVVLPPYYFKVVSDEGLVSWFSKLIQKAVPGDGAFFLYNIPSVSKISLPLEVIEDIRNMFPKLNLGIKDSSGDPDFAVSLGKAFGKDIPVFTGNDRLLSHALDNRASGCITAMANLASPLLTAIWHNHSNNQRRDDTQNQVNKIRTLLEKHQPFPGTIKTMLHRVYGFPLWSVRPPLLNPSLGSYKELEQELISLSLE